MKKLFIILIALQFTFSFAQETLTSCQQAQLNATGLIGEFVPNCEDNGSYVSIQCWSSTGYCWCVDEDGEEIAGTIIPSWEGMPDCSSNIDACTLVPDPGMCEAAIQKYYFNQETQQCEDFTWGGCGGVVPFDSPEECEAAACSQSINDCINDFDIDGVCDEEEVYIDTLNQQIDTILYENFNVEPTNIVQDLPENVDGEFWVNWDEDEILDNNGEMSSWFWSESSVALVDSVQGGVYMSVSWMEGFAEGNRNWLITPGIYLSDDSGELTWKSAPYQTPLWADGYTVYISTTDNSDLSFTEMIAQFGQYLGSNSDTGATGDYSLYDFSDGYIHGADGTYIEVDTADLTRNNGILRPNTVSLAAYAGQTVYIAFVHDSDDDNILFIDDIMITGNGYLYSGLGCTVTWADNYNSEATVDDGSCELTACPYSEYLEYDSNYTIIDASLCQTWITEGCTNPVATNYNPEANVNDGTCVVIGCMNSEADNFNLEATIEEENSCIFFGCTNSTAENYNDDATIENGTCIIYGCTLSPYSNYNSEATYDDGSCNMVSADEYGCTDQGALNYNSQANIDNGACEYLSTPDECEEGFSIILLDGWNLIGYSCVNSINAETAFAPLIDILIIVKDNAGNAFLPEWNFNGLGDLLGGYGYQLKITEQVNNFNICE